MNLPQCKVFLVKVPFNLIVQMTETKEEKKKEEKRSEQNGSFYLNNIIAPTDFIVICPI